MNDNKHKQNQQQQSQPKQDWRDVVQTNWLAMHATEQPFFMRLSGVFPVQAIVFGFLDDNQGAYMLFGRWKDSDESVLVVVPCDEATVLGSWGLSPEERHVSLMRGISQPAMRTGLRDVVGKILAAALAVAAESVVEPAEQAFERIRSEGN